MKKIKYMLSLLLLLPFICSCEQEIMDYEGVDGLYFDAQWDKNPNINTDTTRWIRQHYTLVNFAKEGGFELEGVAKIAISGNVKDYDRPIAFKVVAETDSATAIEGIEYELLEQPYIPAGKNHTYLKFKFMLTERMNDKTVELKVQLLPNEHFQFPFVEVGYINGRFPNDAEDQYSTYDHANVHSFFINNMLVEPAGWHPVQFGKYSKKKFELLLKLAYEKFGFTTPDFDNRDVMQSGRAEAIARVTRIFLNEQYNNGKEAYKQGLAELDSRKSDLTEEQYNEELAALTKSCKEYWVLDEDGSMMFVAGVTWTEGQNPDEMVFN